MSLSTIFHPAQVSSLSAKQHLLVKKSLKAALAPSANAWLLWLKIKDMTKSSNLPGPVKSSWHDKARKFGLTYFCSLVEERSPRPIWQIQGKAS